MTRLMIPLSTGVLGVAAAWLATQGGVWPQHPAALAWVIFIVIDSLAVLVPLWLAAVGYGYSLRRWAFDAMPFATMAQAGVGMAVMLVVGWCWGSIRLAGTDLWIIAGMGWLQLAVQLVLQIKHVGLRGWRITEPLQWTMLLGGIPVGLMLVAACCPPGMLWAMEAYGYDVMSYHLQLPREWLADGRIAGLQHNVYSFLPSLMESAYTWLGMVRGGSMVDAIYLCQIFHVSLAIYAAAAIGCLVARVSSGLGGVVAATMFLAAPWSVVTASLAYNEMAMLAFAAAALLVALDPASERGRGAAVVGLLLGGAIFAKPTAGLLVAMPVGVLLLMGWNHVLTWRPAPGWRRGVAVTGVTAAAALAAISPWLVRNAMSTGNPVFPFACGTLGYGHWNAELAQRWDKAHGLALPANASVRLDAIANQWLVNAGYGAIGGNVQQREATNVAVFDTGGGFPLLWATAAGGLLMGMTLRQTRRIAIALAAMLALQVVIWATATHLQSRFLVPTLVPGAVLAGLCIARLDDVLARRMGWLSPSIIIFMTLSLTASSFNEFYSQARPGLDPWDIVDSLDRGIGHHPLDDLPSDSKTLMVADAGGLLYIDRPIIYATAFDQSPLGDLLRQSDTAPLTYRLSQQGITHVWISWSELQRLDTTYGHDPLVTADTIRKLAATEQWTAIANLGHATLYQLP